jgi:hypothetical protein
VKRFGDGRAPPSRTCVLGVRIFPRYRAYANVGSTPPVPQPVWRQIRAIASTGERATLKGNGLVKANCVLSAT